MPGWLLWTFTALVARGLWAILPKGVGDALSAAHSQTLSALGFLRVIAALSLDEGLHESARS